MRLLLPLLTLALLEPTFVPGIKPPKLSNGLLSVWLPEWWTSESPTSVLDVESQRWPLNDDVPSSPDRLGSSLPEPRSSPSVRQPPRRLFSLPIRFRPILPEPEISYDFVDNAVSENIKPEKENVKEVLLKLKDLPVVAEAAALRNAIKKTRLDMHARERHELFEKFQNTLPPCRYLIPNPATTELGVLHAPLLAAVEPLVKTTPEGLTISLMPAISIWIGIGKAAKDFCELENDLLFVLAGAQVHYSRELKRHHIENLFVGLLKKIYDLPTVDNRLEVDWAALFEIYLDARAMAEYGVEGAAKRGADLKDKVEKVLQWIHRRK